VETPVVHAGEETGVPFLWQERRSLHRYLEIREGGDKLEEKF